MDKVTLYSTHCPKCKVLEAKLSEANIPYEVVDDREKVAAVGTSYGIPFVPLLEIEKGKVLGYVGAVKWIKEHSV